MSKRFFRQPITRTYGNDLRKSVTAFVALKDWHLCAKTVFHGLQEITCKEFARMYPRERSKLQKQLLLTCMKFVMFVRFSPSVCLLFNGSSIPVRDYFIAWHYHILICRANDRKTNRWTRAAIMHSWKWSTRCVCARAQNLIALTEQQAIWPILYTTTTCLCARVA